MKHEGFTIWFTGLSGAGKSTLAEELIRRLRARGEASIEILDGDVVRTHLSKGLGFGKEDRDTNILRIGFVCDLLSRNGVIAIAAAISPYRDVRNQVRRQAERFVEVYVSAPIEELINRDVKGLYKKAISGEVKNFTGISDPYEEPLTPEVLLRTDRESVDVSVRKILRALELLGLIPVASGEPLPVEEELKVALQLEKAGAQRAQPIVLHTHPEESTADAIAPHGGELVDRFLGGIERDRIIDRIDKYRSLTLTARQWSDVELIATGAYSPLTGFVDSHEYRSIISRGRLTSGLAWTIPILLQVHEEQAEGINVSDEIVLRDRAGKNLALLQVNEMFQIEKEELARTVWQSTDEAHPGVRALYEEGTVALAGPIRVLRLDPPKRFENSCLTPRQTRARFREKGWKSIVAFQTRNPIHRAHEYIQKAALELVDGLLLHPLVGETKNDDTPAAVRMECYDVLLKNYYPQQRVLLSVMPAAMRYAGPKEAIHHAIIRQNYGCTHFIVGRDHAGVGNYYGTYDAQTIFDGYTKEELGIVPLKFEHTFYCRKCTSMASERTCPHGPDDRIILSGTKVRERLQNGADLPEEFSRPEVVAVLRKHYQSLIRTASAVSIPA